MTVGGHEFAVEGDARPAALVSLLARRPELSDLPTVGGVLYRANVEQT